MSRGRRLIAGCAASVVAAAGLAACSSSGSDSGGSGSGGSIRLMVDGAISPSPAFGNISFPYGATGVKAAAAAINKKGGIDGHKIQVDVCDSKGDPNGSAKCGREAIANKDIAVVGTFDPIGANQILKVLSTAKIPYIGGLPTSFAELSDPLSFQFDPGPILSANAIVSLWKTSGCKTVASILPSNPGNDQIAKQQKTIADAMGVQVFSQLVSPGVADITPSLSSALGKKPDCFTYSGDGQTNVKYILAARKLGFKGKIITSLGSLAPQFLGPLGPAGEGIVALNSTALPYANGPEVTDFNRDLAAYLGNDKAKIAMNANEFGQDGWSSVELVRQALTGGKEFTSAALLKKIPTMCDVNVGNVYPHVNFCKPVATSKTLTRVYNDHWQYFTVKNGQYAPTDGKWHDLTDTFPTG